ncbi:hypothetical protein NP493_386g04018 [Ridgeia piscesae]|uniref:Uncharacterized protein n=1 Tax=Ridgeia piscesae TaxID=27915 RepID=A0AAD9L1I9_RIDPI|nr:hypothetical protein NP493_386g04018 [Ridgeia piscesae]
MVTMCQSLSWAQRSSRCIGDSDGLRAARCHNVMISSQRLDAAFWEDDMPAWLPRLPWPALPWEEIWVLNHQMRICSHARTSSVSISSSLMAFESFLRNISRTIDKRFQMPSGSRPRRGRNRLCHSAAAGGAVEDR